MGIVMGLDMHRSQITVDALETASGAVRRDRVLPGGRAALRQWLARYQDLALRAAVEGTTACLQSPHRHQLLDTPDCYR